MRQELLSLALALLVAGCPGSSSPGGEDDGAPPAADLHDLALPGPDGPVADLAVLVDGAPARDQATPQNDCPQLAPFRNTANDAAALLQKCIDDTPDGGTLELAVGYYAVGVGVTINKAMTLRTLGKSAADPPCKVDGSDCAQIVPTASFVTPLGMLQVKAGATVDHMVLNGLRGFRTGHPAYVKCKAGDNGPGHNGALLCSGCAFTNSVSAYALCGTGLVVSGSSANVTVTGSTFAYNGVHDQQNLWSDGLTVHDASQSVFSGNTFIDNTDVDLIFGGCQHCKIQNNKIVHGPDVAGGSFAALMIHKWPSTSGSYDGVDVSGNSVDCGPNRRCGSGLYVASESWYPETPFGTKVPGQTSGAIHDNTVVNAMNGLYVAAMGLEIYHTGVLNAHNTPIPASCGKTLTSVTPYVISPTAKSIDFHGENVDPVMKVHFSSASWAGCIPNWPF